MSKSLLFSEQDDLSSNSILYSSTEHINNDNDDDDDEEKHQQTESVNTWPTLALTENSSLLTTLRRLAISWYRILYNKFRLVFTLLFMSMLNITARIACFTRRQTHTSPPSSSTALSSLTISASTERLEEDFADLSKSLLLSDKIHKQSVNLPSLQKSTMAHILVQQQQTHRSPNVTIHSSITTQKEPSIPMRHSVDDRLFLHDSTELINLITRFASEPHMSKYNTQSTHSNGYISKSPVVFALTSPPSNTCVQVIEAENDDFDLNELLYLNCDKIQPVSISSTKDFTNDEADDITSMTKTTIIDSLSEQVTAINNEIKNVKSEDILIDTSPSVTDQDTPTERHFHRRRRRSSLTRNSISLDENLPAVDALKKLDLNRDSSNENEIKLENNQTDEKEKSDVMQMKASDNEEPNQTVVENEPSGSVSRYRGRRLRHRFYRQSANATSPSDVSLNASPNFYLSNEASNVETLRTYSSPPSSPVTLSPLPSPISPTLTILSHPITPNKSTGALKRINSVGGSKKNVRFADSIGRQLTEVQYIKSPNYDESNDFSLLLGSSLLSSSPPSFSKNNIYVPKSSHFDHKPWSFDVDLTLSKPKKGISLPKRFFCLYRQPNSEHPDIYLHEVWKSQIKLEHADIPWKHSSSGEQKLVGTLWVTNASYWKNVSIKYTFNRWLNTYEREAQHRSSSNDYRNIDQFEFSIDIPEDVDRIDFVLRYCVNGQEHWDNNEGKNYTLQTESAYTPSTTISLPHDCDFNEMRFY
ncbi:hypothetical protein I4U23_019098 [Adineta vaga]|nr:hypothetical protein I4U23_019098 [Adineta vaga]